MADNVADLAVRVGADVSPLISGLKKGESSLSSFGKEVTDGTSNLKAYGAAIVAAGTAILAYLYKNTAEAIDAQSKLAKGLNTTYESMTALTYAGDLAGVSQEQMATAVKKMSIAIGELSEGTGIAGEALARLGLSADELSNMSADQRIQAINTAIQEHIPLAEQAAVASDIFGAKLGLAMMQVDPDTIARAREETEAFGLALSDVEAAQIESANDAMTSAAAVLKGALTQAAVLLAPLIESISMKIVQLGKDTSGFKTIIKDAFGVAIELAATAVDAWNFFGTTLKGVGDILINGLVAAVSYAAKTISDTMAWLLEKISYIPGVDFSDAVASLREFSTSANEVLQDSIELFNDTSPYYANGDAIREWAKTATESSQAAAAAAVAARAVLVDNMTETEETMTTKQKEELQKRLDALNEAYMSEAELSLLKRDEQLALLAEGRMAELVQEEEFNALAEEIVKKHEDNLTQIEDKARKAREGVTKKEADSKLAAWQSALSSVSTLMESENKNMFEIGKAAAIASATVDTFRGANAAWGLGPIVGPAMAALVTAAGLANVASIKSQTFSGGGSSSASTADTSAATSAASSASGGGAAAGGTLTVQGLTADSFLSGDSVSELATQLLDYQRNGGKVVLA